MTATGKRIGMMAACLAGTAGLCILAGTAQAQTVADRSLSEIGVDHIGSCTTLTVRFNIRVQLLSYFPNGSGRELHIRLQSLDSGDMSRLRDSLRPPASVPELRSIQFEGDNPAGPVLSLFFAQDMQFDVAAGRDPQSLVIRLSPPGVGTSCADAQPAAVPPSSQRPSDAGRQLVIPEGLHVINLSSSPAAPGELTEAQRQALAGRVVYETLFERDSQQWHRLRAGFFESRAEAEAALPALQALFPDAFVVKVSAEERTQGVANRLASTSPEPQAETSTATPDQEAEAARLVADAESAIADQQEDRAIQILTNALQLPANTNTPRTLELLGLMRERKGQQAQAQAEYEEYLRRYPTGEAADRVRQRLAALGSGPAQPGAPLREASRGGSAADWTWSARGSFSQFYFRDQSSTKFIDASRPEIDPEIDNSVNLNQLLTAADLTIAGGNDRRQLQLRASGSYTANFRTNSRDIQSLTAAYLDYTDTELGLGLRVGRQTRNTAGVLGRFDGALASYTASNQLRFNVVGGFPVLRSRQMSVLTERPFYGISMDVGARRAPVSGTIYWFDQRAKGGFVDRRSVGFETRILLPRFNAFSIIDYDVKYSQLNLGLVTLNYAFPDTSNISLTADYRQSPLLTTYNALIGQVYSDTLLPVPDLVGLRPFFTDRQIYQLANDRTYATRTATLSYSRPIVDHLQANLDVTVTDTDGTPGTPASTGTQEVLGLPASGTEWYYGAQLIGNGLFWDNDIYILSARYADTQRTTSYTADFNARVPLRTDFRLSPRLRYGWRDSKVTDSTFTQMQPTMRFNYYPVRDVELEVELGANFSTQKDVVAGNLTTTSESGFLVTAGYRLDF